MITLNGYTRHKEEINLTLGLVLFLSLFCTNVFSQVHYEGTVEDNIVYGTAGINSGLWNSIKPDDPWILDVAVTNLGNITVGKDQDRLRILSNSGNQIALTNKISTISCIAVASNHNTEVSSVTVASKQLPLTPFSTSVLQIHLSSDAPSNGLIDLARANFLSMTVPEPLEFIFPIDWQHLAGIGLENLEATMNDKYIYISWRQIEQDNTIHYAFAIASISPLAWVVNPQIIKDPNGNLATGHSNPTVACNRWNEDRDHCEIAFAYLDQRPNTGVQHPAIFRPVLSGPQPNAVNLLEPVPPPGGFEECRWVRVVNYDEAPNYYDHSVNSGYHYFYGYYYPTHAPQPVNLTLFSTDNVGPANQTNPILITDRLPQSHYLPPALLGVDTAARGCGNGYTEQAVYLAYVTDQTTYLVNTPEPPQELNLCRQWGNGAAMIKSLNHIPRLSGDHDGDIFLNYTLGCNQMGIIATYTIADIVPDIDETDHVTHQWRAIRPIAQHVRENTLVTNDCYLEVNQWHNLFNDPQVCVFPSESLDQRADTLRILGGNLDELSDGYISSSDGYGGKPVTGFDFFAGHGTLKYVSDPSLPPGIPNLVAGFPIYLENLEEGSWDGPRGCIMIDDRIVSAPGMGTIDNGPRVDFNGVYSAMLGARTNGAIEFGSSWGDGVLNKPNDDELPNSLMKGDALVNMNFSLISIDGNHRFPDTLERHRALAYFNMPVTLNGGTQLRSSKGQIRFKEKNIWGYHEPHIYQNQPPPNPDNLAVDQDDMCELFTKGDNTSIWMDTSIVYLGSRAFGQPLEQIRMNINDDFGESIFIANSIISTGWENLVGYNTLPAGYWSSIAIQAPSFATFYGKTFYTTFIQVMNPRGNVTFDYNTVFDILNQIRVSWALLPSDGVHYLGSVEIDHNIVKANYNDGPGNSTYTGVDFWVSGFTDVGAYSPNQVEISENTIYGNLNHFASGYDYSNEHWTGISIDQGTKANVISNQIYDVTCGIFADGFGTAASLLCSNVIGPSTHNPCECDYHGFAGIWQFSGTGITKLNELFGMSYGHLSAGTDNSVLLRNSLHSNFAGAAFYGKAQTILNGYHVHASTYDYDIPGMNVFDNNESFSFSQLQLLIDATQANHTQPVIGADITGNDESLWGQNKFTSGSNTIHMMTQCLNCSGETWVLLLPTLKLNEWSPALLTSSSGSSIGAQGTTQDPEIDHVEHFNEENVSASLSDIACNDLSGSSRNKNQRPQSYPYHNISLFGDPNNDSLYYYNSGNNWGKIDARKGLDTLRIYVELHPYATKYPGEVQNSFYQTIGLTDRLPGVKYQNYIDNYNWLVKVQPANMEPAYQDAVITTIAMDLRFIDLNDAANMWFNYSLLFPDSSDVAEAWRNIKSIRDYQKLIPQDTTPFHKLTFPLQPLPGGTDIVARIPMDGRFTLSTTPNPASQATTVTYVVPTQVNIKLSLFDILGKEQESVAEGIQMPGTHSVPVDLRNLSGGTYFLRMQYPGGVVTKQLIIQR